MLWILRPKMNDPLWDNRDDESRGFIIRATTEEEARVIAQRNGGDEIRYKDGSPSKAWLLEDHSICEPLIAGGKTGIVMRA